MTISLLSGNFSPRRDFPLPGLSPRMFTDSIPTSVHSSCPYTNLPVCRALAGLMFLFAGGNGQVRTTLMDPAKVKLVLSIGRGVAQGTFTGFCHTYCYLKVPAQESQ